MKLGIGLYGFNGHQIDHLLQDHGRAELVAAAGIPKGREKGLLERFPNLRCYGSLVELLQDKEVQLVSLCSPIRRRQAREAMLCLQEGKHVYAEKPCALTIEELDALVATAAEYGKSFHEMAGTAFDEPYRTMGEIVRSGRLGPIVQVLAQKSYPFFMERPQDEDVDGGLLRQAGIHALRMIEHTAGKKILEVAATETAAGNPVESGGLRMAASYMMKLEDGAIASVISNYLNQPGFGLWGNEALRIFGTKGFVEAVDGGTRTRLVIEGEDLGPLEILDGARDYFDLIVDSILDGTPPPLSTADELHPTRAVLRAKESALAGGGFVAV